MKEPKFDFMNYLEAECPKCRCVCGRHSTVGQTLYGLHGKVLRISYAKYYCKTCGRHFTSPNKVKAFGLCKRYLPEVRELALALLKEHTYRDVAAELRKVGARVPISTLCGWWAESTYARKDRRIRIRRPVEPSGLVVDQPEAGTGAGGAPAGSSEV